MIDSVTDQIVKRDFKEVSGSKSESFSEYKRDVAKRMDTFFGIWFVIILVAIIATIAVSVPKTGFIADTVAVIFLLIMSLIYVIGVCFISLIMKNTISIVGEMESKVAAPLTLEELDVALRIKSVLK